MSDESTRSNDTEYRVPSHIVGIGASAGGLEAIESFFKAMPADSGLAFVVIQHLSPDHKSLMVELLSKRTEMPVHRVTDGMRVEADSVYLIPPNQNLRIFHGRLLLTAQDRDSRSINLPIDLFFRSLAEDQGPKAVGIVLSGTGSDGTRGIRAIKEDLGMAMVQTEESAGFDGMPRSAIATGLVDFILSPSQMPEQLMSYAKHPYAGKDTVSTSLLSDEDGLTRIFAMLRERHKIDFTYYKPSTIVRRIERRMAVNQINDINDYVRFLETYSSELSSLHKDLLIGVTSFFRDPEAFDLLKQGLLEGLFEKARDDRLRLWVPGCSTGEEAYSLAMLCSELRERLDLHMDIKIFATDVDRDAIVEASNGAYPESALSEINQELVAKYFEVGEGRFQVTRAIREMVVFAQHNLVKDPPFTNIDMISCRNLLIYLQPVLQRRVLELFNFALNPKGVLFLGSSETTGEMSEYFETIDQKWRLYRSRGRRRVADLSEPAVNFDSKRWRNAGMVGGRASAKQIHEEERILERLTEGVVGDYLPFTMVINEHSELIQVVGDGARYLRVPTGKLVNDVSKLADPDLNIPLSTGLQKAFSSDQPLTYSNIHLRSEADDLIVDMRLKPLPGKRGQDKLVAVFIEEVRRTTGEERAAAENFDIGREAEQRIHDLENELQFTRENLQATVEELETANEELQATNEELLASNEELQSTNEELQSVNEELYTVNAEYQGKIAELTDANNDLDNLLANIRVATLFIDENLEIRKFTPEMSQLIRILDQDLGRPIDHIAHDMPGVDLAELAREVISSEISRELEVCINSGEEYTLRLFPYQIGPNIFSGVVMTFFRLPKPGHDAGER